MAADLVFRVRGARTVLDAVAPEIALDIEVEWLGEPAEVQSILLQSQVRIEPGERDYSDDERQRLSDLFGNAGRWRQTLPSLVWLVTQTAVPRFTKTCCVSLGLPCSYDFELATAKYFFGLDDGPIPLTVFFRGTIFHSGPDGSLQVAPIPWTREAQFRLPVRLYHEVMEHYFPGRVLVALDSEVVRTLDRFRRAQGLATVNAAIERLARGAM